ncbi:hypothetical protein AZE42_10897 [Rhizopogon vesiculosus]|uniref:Thioester reductase (TE) domain-containing protein n=1 Tax=Rhizopogon vesiculosus TaxID=180088 RepID=A0A1J8QGZ9_9AGAM|nr:hypothetical protein AZE42_10897 [Rhizopogon vesiculosus]
MPQIDEEVLAERMLSAARRHGAQLPRHIPKELHQRSRFENVLIIGTRGGLGSELLAQLLVHPSVLKVYALNRVHQDGKTPKRRQGDEFRFRGIKPSLLESSNLVLLEGDISETHLGLQEDQFREIAETVTAIILNGWRVNFASPLHDFEPAMAGTRQLIEMALASPHRNPPRFIFSSTIGIFQNVDTRNPMREIPVEDPRVTISMGYRESKWVIEQMLTAAAEAGLSSCSVRIGQITGNVNGAWGMQEWFPATLKSSQVIGCLPMDYRAVNWIPAQLAARAMIELIESDEPIVHLVHTQSIPFTDILRVAQRMVGVPVVSQVEWLRRLESYAEINTSREARRHAPAVRMLPFFRQLMALEKQDDEYEAMAMPRVSTERLKNGAPCMVSPPPVSEEEIRRWIQHWQSAGFLAHQSDRLSHLSKL